MSFASRIAIGLTLVAPTIGAAAAPTSTDARLTIELVAKEPDIVTPTGIAVDGQGRIWVIENHTHQRPPGYKGPPSDRIRIFADFDAAGHARSITTFAEGFKNSMALAFGRRGTVYFATRSEVYVLRDSTGSGKADEKRLIVKLDSKGDYPHNGLSGFAFDGLDNVYFAIGENLGTDYKLIGSDGSTLTGGGEGGNIFRCRADGSKLVRVATGFWNTFHLTIDAFGRLFAVDNDPDSRGPCRLLHVVQGGDYGYRYRNGRKGLHPFTAWNGELPGTLPMLSGTAEAPSGVLAYESRGLPDDYRGSLLVTSWGDHVVERFTLEPHGATFRAKQQTLIRGGEDFRPVGIATGPDGTVYLSDWMDKSYPVHGNGRIWRIRAKTPPKDDGIRVEALPALEPGKLETLLAHPRREVRAAAAEALTGKGKDGRTILERVVRDNPQPRVQMEALWAMARHYPDYRDVLARALESKSPEVRGECARLLGELVADPEQRETALTPVFDDPAAFVRIQAMAQRSTPEAMKALIPALLDKDPFIAAMALDRLGRPGNSALLRSVLRRDVARDIAQRLGYSVPAANAKLRLGILLALRRAGEAEGRETLRAFLDDADPEVRRAAIQWVGEERLRDFMPLLSPAAARLPVSRELFEAYLATSDFLSGPRRKPGDETSGEQFVVKVLQDAKQPAAIHAIALRMLRPDHPVLTPTLLKPFVSNPDQPELRLEAVRTLAQRSDAPSQTLLRTIAADKAAAPGLRNEAIAGLGRGASSVETQALLFGLLSNPDSRRDALRSLREPAAQADGEAKLLAWFEGAKATSPEERRELAAQVELALRSNKSPAAAKGRNERLAAAGPRPANEAQWKALLATGGDAAAGARVFFHANGPRCSTCHRVDGRGGRLGPDLSKIGLAATRDKLIDSVLTPSKEIAPLFVAWSIATRDGKVRTGLIVEEGAHSTIALANAEGKIEIIKRQEVEERHALATSIMPDNLADQMTPREFVDLIAFLSALR